MTIASLAQELAASERALRVAGGLPPAYIDGLFPLQRAFIDDPATLKIALCGRRAGKSYSRACDHLWTAERIPGSTSVYVALTRPSAKRIMWDDPKSGLLALVARYGLDFKANHTDLSLVHANGSRIYLVGADDVQAIERLRGTAYALATVDEAASFGPLRLASLVRDVLRPATLDLRGTIALVGTPGAALIGLFHDASTGVTPGWSTHTWTALDNPHVRDAAGFFAEERRVNGWDANHPTFLREYMAKWTHDASGLVYPYDAARNGIAALPDAEAWTQGLGVDYGFGNATASVVVKWRAEDPCVYVAWSEKRAGLTPSDGAAWVQNIERTHGSFERMVGDVGGLGKGYAEEARQRWGLPITPAKKSDKRAAQELLAGDMLAGRVKFVIGQNAALLDEMAVLQWGPGREEEDARFDNDLCDALLYAWREAKAWFADHLPPKPDMSAAAQAARAKARWAERVERNTAADAIFYGDEN